MGGEGIVQTFLPYPDFTRTAKTLDNKRLGKQRVEAYQILRTLLGEGPGGWKNHPAVKMWKGSEGSLLEYGKTICREWISRGYRDTVLQKLETLESKYSLESDEPIWLGRKEFHRSHRSNLLRKDNEYYSRFDWKVEPGLPYLWPGG